MKRTFVLMLVLSLVLALALPSVALAKRGGVPASDNGKGRPAAAVEAEAADEAVDAESAAPGKGAGKAAEKAARKGAGAADDAESDGESPKARVRDRVQDRERTQDHERTQDREQADDGAGEGKRTGIPNALSRLEANLARMQAELDAGERTSLPPGLQRAIVKFMSWLGIAPDDVTVPDAGDDSDGASEETSPTVEPDEGDPEDGDPADGSGGEGDDGSDDDPDAEVLL